VQEAARAADSGNASAVPPPPGGHLPASSWALVVLLVLPAAGLVALQASPRVQGRLPPVDLRSGVTCLPLLLLLLLLLPLLEFKPFHLSCGSPLYSGFCLLPASLEPCCGATEQLQNAVLQAAAAEQASRAAAGGSQSEFCRRRRRHWVRQSPRQAPQERQQVRTQPGARGRAARRGCSRRCREGEAEKAGRPGHCAAAAAAAHPQAALPRPWGLQHGGRHRLRSLQRWRPAPRHACPGELPSKYMALHPVGLSARQAIADLQTLCPCVVMLKGWCAAMYRRTSTEHHLRRCCSWSGQHTAAMRPVSQRISSARCHRGVKIKV
jgi:hypothetical protein